MLNRRVIEVTQRNIDLGKTADPYRCPIANACRRVFRKQGEAQVIVGGGEIEIKHFFRKDFGIAFDVDDGIQDFIERFDDEDPLTHRLPVTPIAILLEWEDPPKSKPKPKPRKKPKPCFCGEIHLEPIPNWLSRGKASLVAAVELPAVPQQRKGVLPAEVAKPNRPALARK